jgi:D-alanyl-D-alanine carboxypeptidase/D-alanyl-D-alanine-endopeptidase (penicillin-binding protein 4)
LGAKYVLNPLGEEFAPDTDPLIREDAFDCVTFVETSMAAGDEKSLKNIRYKNGKVGFLNRNHFIETDWLKNNSNLIKNVTSSFGKTKIRKVTIDKENWLKKIHKIVFITPIVKTELEYIPYSEIKNIKTDKSLIVVFVMDNPKIHAKIGTDLAISHIGFLLPNGILRHASSDKNIVTDVDFVKYINARKKNKKNLGIALYEIK